jgi:glutathione-regulated potassium-efflux system ancillary protein KefC
MEKNGMEKFIFDLSLVLVAAALLSFIAVILKQPIIIAYIVCGMAIGPWGLGYIRQVEFIEAVSHLGITLLLFLAGLCLHPQKLIGLFKHTAVVTLINCMVSFLIAYLFALTFQFTRLESVCVGLAMMFSSTILTVKLLPTTRLHHERMGAVCIGVLILQDLVALGALAFIRCLSLPGSLLPNFAFLLVKFIAFIAVLVIVEQFILGRIMGYVERLHEALFILGLAWCFGVAAVSHQLGLFYETGAFFAGVVLARHKISFFISENLKPLRDFFLVLFFFTLGAKLDLFIFRGIWPYALLLAGLFLGLKPLLFKYLFLLFREQKSFATEIGMRLGNLSEFSLIIGVLALELGHISVKASQFIQLVTIFTFIVSSYIVVFKYPTPIGVSKNLKKD